VNCLFVIVYSQLKNKLIKRIEKKEAHFSFSQLFSLLFGVVLALMIGKNFGKRLH